MNPKAPRRRRTTGAFREQLMGENPPVDNAHEAGTEFPQAIGRVANRELAAHGFTSYADLSRVTAGDLLAIHGIGPKAVRILGEELARRGLDFRP